MSDRARFIIRARPLSGVPWVHYVSRRGTFTGNAAHVAVIIGEQEARRDLEYWRTNYSGSRTFHLEKLPPRLSVEKAILQSEDVDA